MNWRALPRCVTWCGIFTTTIRASLAITRENIRKRPVCPRVSRVSRFVRYSPRIVSPRPPFHLWMILGDLPKRHICGLVRLKARGIDAPHQEREDGNHWDECNHRKNGKRKGIPYP